MSWAASIYESDKRSASLCTELSQNGFGFDSERARLMSLALRDLEVSARLRAEAVAGRPIRGGKGGGFSPKDLASLFFRELKAPIFLRSALTGAPSLSVDVMRAYAAGGRDDLRSLSLAILEWRRARKLRVTYIDNVVIGSDGRVHPSWLSYGAVSGRWACQGPNLMNLPTQANDPTRALGFEGGIRGLYRAMRPGHVILAFDCSQLEMRVAAYASGDVAMIAACESVDMHASNATMLFGTAFTELAKFDSEGHKNPAWDNFRQLAKTAGFAVAYLAEANTVYARLLANGVSVPLRQVEAMLRRLRRGFHGYYQWQDARLLDAIRLGYTDEPVLGRRRWLGHDPSPTECANFPIQAGAAGHMNSRLPGLAAQLRSEFGALTVAQVHDSGVFEIRESAVALASELIVARFEAPQEKLRGARLPVDLKVSERWS